MSLSQRIAAIDAGGDVHDTPVPVEFLCVCIARGDLRLDEGEEAKLASPIKNVDDARWTQFVAGMVSAEPGAVSKTNCIGMFELTPRRLGDLGLAKQLARTKHGESGKTVWVAALVPPLTADAILGSPDIQYAIFERSMKDYADKIDGGEIVKPEDMSLSGALAILHRAGPNGLQTWVNGERFPQTTRAYDRVAGIF